MQCLVPQHPLWLLLDEPTPWATPHRSDRSRIEGAMRHPTSASMRIVVMATLSGAGSLAFSTAAEAESYCVACFGPDAVYRCVIADAPSGAAPDPRNQVQCIKQIATSGGHSRCSVERFSTAGCDGPERVISREGATGPLAPDVASQPPATAAPASEPPAVSAEPPKTVEELAKSTVQATKDGLDNVTGSVKNSTDKAGENLQGIGQSIGSTAKKTWTCISSFFNDC